MARFWTTGTSDAGPIKDPHTPIRKVYALPLDLEELDLRLEAAFPSLLDFHTDEACVWACACFLVDGSLL